LNLINDEQKLFTIIKAYATVRLLESAMADFVIHMKTMENLQFAPKDVMVRKDLDLRAGDTVRVHVKIQEKGKTRIQIFEGLVLARKHGSEPGATFTVRKISNGVGVERIFPLYSPMIDKIEVLKRSRVRRSKLYFLRDKVARDIRRKMRNFVEFTATTDDLVVPEEEMLEEEVVEEGTEATDAAEPAGKETPEAPAEEEPTATEEVKEESTPEAESNEEPVEDTPESEDEKEA
jgi:large subunit ribosomal protein L19